MEKVREPGLLLGEGGWELRAAEGPAATRMGKDAAGSGADGVREEEVTVEALPCRWQQRRRAAGAGGAGHNRTGICVWEEAGGRARGRAASGGPLATHGGPGGTVTSSCLHYRTTQRSTPTRQRLGECALLVLLCHCLLSRKSPSGAFRQGRLGPREGKGLARSHTAMWRQKQNQCLPAPSTP